MHPAWMNHHVVIPREKGVHCNDMGGKFIWLKSMLCLLRSTLALSPFWTD